MSSSESTQFSPWLIPDFVQKILRESENDESIKVQSVTSKPAVAGGDNYMSDISRVHIDFTRSQTNHEATESKTLIFKVSFSKDSPAGEMGKECEVFETEIEMMKNTLEKMNKSLNEKDYRLSPRAYYTQIGDPSFLVVEDLAARGFRMANRRLGLDLDHCLLVMRGLAKFHASSVAIYEKDPTCIRNYQKGIYYKDCSPKIRAFVAEAFKSLSTEVKNWPELDSSYSDKILNLMEVCYDKGIECSQTMESEFKVINHGDTWVNNLMFRDDKDGKVVDQIFLDFQIPAWSSPAYDLQYFLNTSTNDDVQIHHYDKLITEYSKTLCQTMSRMNCKTKPPTLDWIRECLSKREFLAILASVLCLPFVVLDKDKVVSLSDMLKPEGTGSSPGFKDERYRRIMTRRLKYWNSRGLLDA
ncbi:uncharacterized protein [Venturia canescens]|uniref:uncharacterized protein n=1 Tax=Venturia canescens TaxID=32260 RepID=UPI001C9CA4FA|nr:uncharacterized protein LOC122415508 [Venturia canescens]